MATSTPIGSQAASIRSVYDEIATEYDERVLGAGAVETRFAGAERSFILERVRPTDAVLDLGCGTGRCTLPIAQAGASVTGLDISEGMIERAREKLAAAGLAAELTTGDMCALPFADDAFDVAVSMLALMHIDPPDRDRVFAEVARVLRPGGTLLVGVKNALIERLVGVDRIATVDVTDLAAEELVFTATRGGRELRAAWHSFSPTELTRLCARSGLQLVGLVGNVPLAAWIADPLLEDPRIGAVVAALESLVAEVPPFNHFGYHLLMEATKPATRG